MYAIIISGNQQIKVKIGDIIQIKKTKNHINDIIKFEKILFFTDSKSINIGNPILPNISVIGKIFKKKLTKKIHIIKFHRRKNSIKKIGYRQPLILVKILNIQIH